MKMKTKLFIIAMASLGLASCASDEVTSTLQSDAIEFRTGMGTRADETVDKTIEDNGFHVLALTGENNAVKTADNEWFSYDYTKQGNVWKANNPSDEDKIYWPKEHLNFYAYYPYTKPENSTSGLSLSLLYNGKVSPCISNFAPADDPKDQVDFVYATNNGSRSNFTSVPLTFKHGLTQVALQAKNSNKAYTVEVMGVRIGYVQKRGEFTFPEGVTSDASGSTVKGDWTLSTDTPGDYESVFSSSVTLSQNAASLAESGSFMILPQTATRWVPDKNTDGVYLAVLVKITGTGASTEYANGEVIYPKYYTDGDETPKAYNYQDLPAGYGWAAVPINIEWEAGTKYTYILDFSEGAGKVAPDPGTPDPDVPDPYEPGDDIMKHEITFTVKVESWTTLEAQDAPMDEAINENN